MKKSFFVCSWIFIGITGCITITATLTEGDYVAFVFSIIVFAALSAASIWAYLMTAAAAKDIIPYETELFIVYDDRNEIVGYDEITKIVITSYRYIFFCGGKKYTVTRVTRYVGRYHAPKPLDTRVLSIAHRYDIPYEEHNTIASMSAHDPHYGNLYHIKKYFKEYKNGSQSKDRRVDRQNKK